VKDFLIFIFIWFFLWVVLRVFACHADLSRRSLMYAEVSVAGFSEGFGVVLGFGVSVVVGSQGFGLRMEAFIAVFADEVNNYEITA
jgi:hypothetical protein